MDANIDRSTLMELIAEHAPPCISIFMPTHPTEPAGRQDAIRLRGLLETTDETLRQRCEPGRVRRELLSAARALPLDCAQWQDRTKGLALFISPRYFRHFGVAIDLEELVNVTHRFLIKPLLPEIEAQQRYWILTLSPNSVRLALADLDGLHYVQSAALPRSLSETVEIGTIDCGTRFHSGAPTNKKKESAVFHGQADRSNEKKKDIRQFFHAVDASLIPILREDPLPLLLAGVADQVGLFREVCQYDQILDRQIEGNCEHLTDVQLLAKGSAVISAARQALVEQEAKQLCNSLDGLKASDNPYTVVPAACGGRVATLFVERDEHLWGRIGATSGSIYLRDGHPSGDDDLLDVAAAETIRHDGTVFCVNRGTMPTDKPIAAMFRPSQW